MWQWVAWGETLETWEKTERLVRRIFRPIRDANEPKPKPGEPDRDERVTPYEGLGKPEPSRSVETLA